MSRNAPFVGSEARTMFSATVMTGMSMKCWCTMPMPIPIACDGDSTCTSSPSRSMRPSSGLWSPYRTFISVDFPAPFSPSRAWISPRRSSRSILSFATSAPKRLVTPSSCSASGPVTALLLHRVGDAGDLSVGDLLLDLVELALVLGALGVELAVARGPGLDVEQGVGAALERACLDGLGGVEHGDVDLLQRRSQDLRAEVGLVGVDADALNALLLRGVERADTAAPGDLEDDLGALGDLVERQLLALVRRDEVLRVRVERLDAGVGRLGAGLVAGDVVVDGRDLLAADARDDLLAALVLDQEAREIAGDVPGLLLLEQQPLHVGRLALHIGLRVVDDREVGLRERFGDLLGGVGHLEAVGDHQVVLLTPQCRQVGDVV